METETKPQSTWGFLLRVLLKAAVLFALCNLIFALTYPMEMLGRVSLYNRVLPGRLRLPFGENPAQSYNVTLNNIPAMLESHIIQRGKAADEFRVILIGDSSTWGWLLPPDETLAAAVNDRTAMMGEKRLIAYNLGYPELALSKDLLLLDAALQFEPDLIVWPVTLQSFHPDRRLSAAIVRNNPARMRELMQAYGIELDETRFVEPNFRERTIVGQRRPLADLLRLQTYGFAWQATRIDQYIPEEIPLRRSDFEADASWETYPEAALSKGELSFDLLEAGIAHAGDTPVLIVNEPIFISDGENSDIRYNSFYPRWAYDQYRDLIATMTQENDWHYLDLWDRIAPDEFTDTPVHMTPAATAEMAALVVDAIQAQWQGE